MTYKEIESRNIWKPNTKGDSVEGVLKAKVESSIHKGNFVYDIEKKDKETITVFGTVVLNDRMAQTKVGDKLKIVFEGTDLPKVKGHNPTKLFKVFKDE